MGVLAAAATAAGSVALEGFGLDSLIEIGASTVVVWQLTDTGGTRERVAMRLIGGAFIALAIYIAVQATYLLTTGTRPAASPPGIAWTAITFTPCWRWHLAKRGPGPHCTTPYS